MTIAKEYKLIKFYNNSAPEIKIELESIYGKGFFKRDIKRLVRNYYGACKLQELGHITDDEFLRQGLSLSDIAKEKLTIISLALNEGWLPDFTKPNQIKYIPLFKPEPFELYKCERLLTLLYAPVICYKSEDLAKYAAHQFKNLYKDYIFPFGTR